MAKTIAPGENDAFSVRRKIETVNVIRSEISKRMG